MAVKNEPRTDTWTTTSAVSAASVGLGSSVTTSASHQANPAAQPALATVPISVQVGGAHVTALATRRHTCSTRSRSARFRDCAAAGDPSPVVTAACQSSFSTAIALISMRYSGDVIFVTSTIVDAGNGSLKYSPRTAWINGKCSMLRT